VSDEPENRQHVRLGDLVPAKGNKLVERAFRVPQAAFRRARDGRQRSSSIATFSFFAISFRWLDDEVRGNPPQVERWQRERIVGSTFCGSVVAKMNFTCAGGSSSVLSSALNACVVSMSTSSMSKS